MIVVGRKIAREVDVADAVCRLAIVLLPFALLIDNDWIFPNPGSVDRWIYSGIHLHLLEFLSVFGDTYYTSRLPWTVIGWALHSALSDTEALIVLHFAVFYLAVFSLYSVVKSLFANPVAAGCAAFLFGTDPHFLHAAGWDYVDGATLSCIMAAFAALAAAAVRLRWRLGAFFWGVATCAMVSMYILVVLLVPVQIGMFLLLNRSRERRSVLAGALLFVGGFAAAMLFFGLVNWLLGGPFPYLLNQVRALSAVAANRFKYDEPLLSWASQAYWLFATAITFVFSFLYVIIKQKAAINKLRCESRFGSDPELSLFIICLGTVTASFIFILLQADHFYVLQMDYNADALLPFAYLSIGGALSVAMAKMPSQFGKIGIFAAFAGITLIAVRLATVGVLPREELFSNLPLDVGWVMAGALLLLLVVLQSRQFWGWSAVVSYLSFVNIGAPSGTATAMGYKPDPTYRPETLAIFEASRAISTYNRDARARFWFDASDSQAMLLRGVVSSYLYAYSLVNERFPSMIAADARRSSIAPGQRIILLTSKSGDAVALANVAVADQDLSFEQVAKIEIRRSGVAFNIIVADVRLAPDAIAHARSLSLGTMRRASQGVLAQRSSTGIVFRSSAEPWAYVGRMPLFAWCLDGGGWVAADVTVTHGTIGVGVLNREGDDFVIGDSAEASDKMQTIFLRLDSFATAGDLVLRNWGERSIAEGILHGVRIVSKGGQTPATCEVRESGAAAEQSSSSRDLSALRTIVPLETLQLQHGSSLSPRDGSTVLKTPPQQWAYAANAPFPLPPGTAGFGIVRVRLQVEEGELGIGVLARDRSGHMLAEQAAEASDAPTDVDIPIADLADAESIVFRSWSQDGVSVRARILSIEILHKLTPQQAKSRP